jgi:DNA-binding CsgD family transcriptional regulator
MADADTVAVDVFVSRHTVDFHLRSIFRKVDVTSRTELTARIVTLEGREAVRLPPTS